MKSTDTQKQTGTVGRAIALLELISAEGPLRFAELKERTNLPKATLHRLLNELQNERLLQFDERGLTYSSGYRILELANRVWQRTDLRLLTRDQLLTLNELSNETVQIAVHAGIHAVIIDQVDSTQHVRHSTSVGSREPVYCTGAGKALLACCSESQQLGILEQIEFVRYTPQTITDKTTLLAELASIQKSGVSIDKGEHYNGTACIAVPIVDLSDRAIASISISAPIYRVSVETLCGWTSAVLNAASQIANRLEPSTEMPENEGKDEMSEKRQIKRRVG